jgi:DNA-binding NarL/FixJ family response regulator
MQSANHHHSRGPRILVVDDNAFMRRSLRYVLESQDQWEVVDEASDGVEAVAKFGKEKENDNVDAVVIDFQMPRMNGLEAARRIEELSPGTPILMVTLHNSRELAEEARKAGILGVCGKSDIGCVVEGVNAILENQPYFKN